MTTLTLAEFLLARIAEDEREANVCLASPEHSARRWRGVLAECQAKRAIVTSYQSAEAAIAGPLAGQGAGPTLVAAGMATGLKIAMQLLASLHSEHPDYLPAWGKLGATDGAVF